MSITFWGIDGWTTEDNGDGSARSATVRAHAEGTKDLTEIKSAFTSWLASDGPENENRRIDGDTSLIRQSVRCREVETTDRSGFTWWIWECEARYAPVSRRTVPDEETVPSKIGDIIESGESAGGEQNVKFALDCPASGGDTEADEEKLIGFSGETPEDMSVEGVNIPVGLLAWEETHYVAKSKVTDAQKKTWTTETGKVNNATWKGFGEHEVRFRGARWRFVRDVDESEAAEVTYRFEALPTKNMTFTIWDPANPNATTTTTVSKRGWDYVSQRMVPREKETTGITLLLPKAVYVQQVHEEVNMDTVIIT